MMVAQMDLVSAVVLVVEMVGQMAVQMVASMVGRWVDRLVDCWALLTADLKAHWWAELMVPLKAQK